MQQATGGYVILRQPLVRDLRGSHTASLDRPVSDIDIDALSKIQATPWRINRWVLDVMSEAWDRGMEIGGLACPTAEKPPPRLPDAVWEGMTQEERKAHVVMRREMHDAAASALGRQQMVLDKLTVAEQLRDKAEIWFPHNRDFRGRIYPIPVSGPHPQDSDIGKALLMFASGLPLGPDGLFWLCVRAANCYGMDKLPLEERVAWTLGKQAEISTAVSSPLSCTWWTEADEPWCFLATCYELATAISSSSTEDFVSHLSIPMDGSCNGLQHLSAMALDPVGARATNLRPGSRQDIYEDVAAIVKARVETDAAAGHEQALQWHGRITRKVVKRAVMTTPYGVTDRGIRTQLISDGFLAEMDGKGAAADYLKDCLVDALRQTIEAGRGVMAWLQTVADRLARAGLPFDWTTPTGSRVRQAYHSVGLKELKTLVGRVSLEDPERTAALVPRKQALGSAPNFVHSFDAAHMALTVLEAHDEGIRSFAMIHDSFGTHARNATVLACVLRRTFVEIYKTDWLRRVYADIRSEHPHVDIPEPPARGTFQIDSVMDAEFFFS